MPGQVADDFEFEVAQWADGQGHLLGNQALHKGFVFFGAHAVVDADDFQQIQRFPNVFGRAFFTGMGDGGKTLGAGLGKDALEFRGRVAEFARIQSDAVDMSSERLRLGKRFKRGFFAQMSQETHNQSAGNAPFFLRFQTCTGNAVDDGFKRYAARGMGLRVEEDFGVDDVVLAAAGEIGGGQVVKILLVEQDRRRSVVNIEEGLEVVKIVSAAHGVYIRIGNGNAVASGDGEHQFRLERAFDMDVQFGFRQGAD
ncbi:hypothetical protein NEISICOT_01819 [Neisseria sicca ATCC 29256]|uniref:Uncharacterized protein n=1 Tax=Neisseria sicca ATCC 29256 TaxID=547045 RepID=C6M5M0_NEISI|nr:hypothetical protein NEISICOT_01819 [Neisseria sicca ATCC 29256]